MSERPFDADQLIDASLPLLDMSLGEASRAGVKVNLQAAERLSKLVTSFEFEDEVEPAPVFSP